MTSASPDDAQWRFPNRATPVGSANYYAVRFSPEEERERNALLIAWYELIQQIADRPHDPGVARLKLDWWRGETAALGAGKARHPLAIALHAAGLDDRALAAMQAIVDAADAEIRSPVPVDEAEFERACRASLGNFFLLLAALASKMPPEPEPCLRAGGYCAAVERLRRAMLSPQRLPPDLAPRVLDALPAGQRRERCDRLLDRLRPTAADSPLPDLARRLTALAAQMHRKMRRRGYPVADSPIERAPIAHLWTAWRAR